MIYEKTMAGLDEISGKRRVLSARHRQVLIMVDGKRSCRELEIYLSHLDVPHIIADLARLGYIDNLSSEIEPSIAIPAISSVPLTQPLHEPIPEPRISQAQLAAIKEILIASTNECLGIIGRSMSEKIEAVKNQEELKPWLSQWHMAIRESRLGKPLASVLMEQVQLALAGTGSE